MFAISTDSVAFCCITAKTCLGTSSRRKVLYCWSHFGTLPTGTNLHKHRNTALYFILQLQTNGSVVKKKNSSFFVSFLRPTLNLKFVLFTFPLIPSLHFNPIHILTLILTLSTCRQVISDLSGIICGFHKLHSN